MKLKPQSVLIPYEIKKRNNLRLRLTKSQKKNILRYVLKYIYVKLIKK